MKDVTTSPVALTMGIDPGDRHSHCCVLDASRTVIDEGRLSTSPAAFRVRVAGVSRVRIALEVGTHSPWVIVSALPNRCATTAAPERSAVMPAPSPRSLSQPSGVRTKMRRTALHSLAS